MSWALILVGLTAGTVAGLVLSRELPRMLEALDVEVDE